MEFSILGPLRVAGPDGEIEVLISTGETHHIAVGGLTHLTINALDGIAIARFDVFTKLHEIVAQPQAFGLTNVTSACITPQSAPFHCQNPDEFLFWDGIHPTRAAHGIIAHEVATALFP